MAGKHWRAAGAALAVACAGGALGDEPRRIATHERVPMWGQHDDFRDFYRDRPTDLIELVDGADRNIPYGRLSEAGTNARFQPRNAPFYKLFAGAPANTRRFAASDFYKADRDAEGANLAGGGWHCAPTAGAMQLEWGRQTVLRDLPAMGGRRGMIDYLAQEADTNDQNAAKNNGDNLGHLGTRRADLIDAQNAFIKQAPRYNKADGPKATEFKYSRAAYMAMIDKNLPVLLLYKYTDFPYGHAVVGTGYHIADADDGRAQFMLTKDPWYPRTEGFQVFENVTDVNAGGVAGGDDYTYGGVPPTGMELGEPGNLGTSVRWEDARMVVLSVPDYGDAPSSFDPITAPASHRVGHAEWLGSRVTGEVDKFDAADDADGVANVGGFDGGDDGVRFEWGQGEASRALVTVSTLAFGGDARYRAGDQMAQLFLGVWADFNGDMQWTPDERIFGDYIGGPGLGAWGVGQPSAEFSLDFLYPQGAPENVWFRFRLAYGEEVGPTGLSEFGEVEDYYIPAPSGLAVLVVGGVVGRRRTEPRALARADV